MIVRLIQPESQLPWVKANYCASWCQSLGVVRDSGRRVGMDPRTALGAHPSDGDPAGIGSDLVGDGDKRVNCGRALFRVVVVDAFSPRSRRAAGAGSGRTQFHRNGYGELVPENLCNRQTLWRMTQSDANCSPRQIP